MKKLDNAPMVIYRYICEYFKQNNFPPTIREICTHVGLSSPSTVHRHMKTLQQQGLIDKDPHKQRAYVISNYQNASEDAIPLVGSVAAGIPINALENIEELIAVPNMLTGGLPSDETFMLKVKGMSMKNAGIMDGDIIVLGIGQSVCNGDIVVARIDNEDVTVKRFQRKNDVIILIPENSEFAPLIIPQERVEIIGKVVGLMRPYH